MGDHRIVWYIFISTVENSARSSDDTEETKKGINGQKKKTDAVFKGQCEKLVWPQNEHVMV